MKEEFYRTSKITGRKYNLFQSVKILNLSQVCAYIKKEVPIEDIQVSQDRNGKDILVFYFDRDLSHDAYDEWCRNKQENSYD